MTGGRSRVRPLRESRVPQPTPAEVADNLEPYRITQARRLAGMSRKDLAEAMGVTPALVCMWEMASAAPRPHHVLKLAEVLEMPVGFFARGRPMARLDAADCHFRPKDWSGRA